MVLLKGVKIMAIGKRLDALLQVREIKPGTLASQTGINKNAIYAIIKRDSEKVNMSALHKIADALRMNIDFFPMIRLMIICS